VEGLGLGGDGGDDAVETNQRSLHRLLLDVSLAAAAAAAAAAALGVYLVKSYDDGRTSGV